MLGLLPLSLALARPALLRPSARAPRTAAIELRIKNSASEGAAEWNKNPSLKPPKKTIAPDQPDLNSPSATFDALCRMCGVAEGREAAVDFDGFVLAFEQLYNRGVPLDPEPLDELRAAVGSENNEDVTMARWDAFHRGWLEASTMSAHLSGKVEAKQMAADAEAERQAMAKEMEKKESEFSQQLIQAKQVAAQTVAAPKLLANEAAKESRKRGKWFEEQESRAMAAAAYRSLAPEKWTGVTDGVGGLTEALEEIRRRIWTPLCAPRSLLDELGAERVKGLLLYGPPGCGKSYLAARLSAGLSRRPPTVVSGPEIMDKYVGNSEATLRQLFTSPPQVPARPGDAADVMMVAEDNELHVVVLDEFDAIARKRSDGMKADTSTRDSVVNQLLVLMDGVAKLPVPTFVLALTNRRELIDEAVLRPGRLEVGRPDAEGRAAILRIHAEKMRASGRLALDDGAAPGGDEDGCTLEQVDEATYGAWVEGIAAQTAGFSGAAMAAVVRAAVARALDRSVSSADVSGCRVSGGDFQQAIADVRSSSLELEQMRSGAAEEEGSADAARTEPAAA